MKDKRGVGMEESNKYKRLKEIVYEYDKSKNKVVSAIIDEIKCDCQTYKQVNRELMTFKKDMLWSNRNTQKYEHLFNEVARLLEEEKNDLPLTNRSR